MEDEDRNIIMADMEGLWLGAQPLASARDQGTVNIYVTMALQLILMNPWISTPQILAGLVEVDWAGSETGILRYFGGWRIFAQTIDRMETLRAGVINERMMDFPITTAPLAEGAFGMRPPEPDGSITWRAPQLERGGPPFLFRIVRAGEGVLHRYPHQGTYSADNSGEEMTDLDAYSTTE